MYVVTISRYITISMLHHFWAPLRSTPRCKFKFILPSAESLGAPRQAETLEVQKKKRVRVTLTRLLSHGYEFPTKYAWRMLFRSNDIGSVA